MEKTEVVKKFMIVNIHTNGKDNELVSKLFDYEGEAIGYASSNGLVKYIIMDNLCEQLLELKKNRGDIIGYPDLIQIYVEKDNPLNGSYKMVVEGSFGPMLSERWFNTEEDVRIKAKELGFEIKDHEIMKSPLIKFQPTSLSVISSEYENSVNKSFNKISENIDC